MSDTNKGYAYVMSSAFLTGVIFVIAKVALVEISPTYLVAWIFSIAAVFLGIWSVVNGSWREIFRCNGRVWLHILLFSIFSIAALQTLWMGVQHLDPTVAAFLNRLQVFVAVILGIIFLRERFGIIEAIGGMLLLGGVVVIRISFDVNLSYWFWITIVSGVFFGITEVFAKQAVGSLHPIPLNFVRNSIIAVFFIVILLVQGKPLFEFHGTWWYLLAMGMIGPMLSRLCFLYALSYLEVSKATLLNQLQPLYVSLIAFPVLGLIPTAREWIGGVLILAGCVVMIQGKRKIERKRRDKNNKDN